MPHYYKLPQSGVSSISIDGIEHKVDPDTGIVTVDIHTQNLVTELKERNAVAVSAPKDAGDKPASKDAGDEPAPPVSPPVRGRARE